MSSDEEKFNISQILKVLYMKVENVVINVKRLDGESENFGFYFI